MRKEIEEGTAPHSFGRDFVQSNYKAQGLDELDAAYTAWDSCFLVMNASVLIIFTFCGFSVFVFISFLGDFSFVYSFGFPFLFVTHFISHFIISSYQLSLSLY